MMDTKKLGLWHFECDPKLTRAVYAAELRDPCGCSTCRNFRALGSSAFPSAARAILLDLGIDPSQPAELHQAGTPQAGKVPYAGWFHFIGRALAGDRESVAEAEGGFQYFILVTGQKVAKRFAVYPVLQFEFAVSLPWVLSETCPQ